jgi:hypothetical protein
MRRRRAVRLARIAAIAALALASAGCARLLGSYAIAPSGLPAGEDRLRHMLAAGQAGAAFDRLGKSAPDDEVLHALYHGTLAYHAGRYDEAARVLDIAADLADERMTKSLSRAALSIVTSDLILDYEPGRAERLMIPYYAALSRLRLGDVDGAAVEARRLSLLLQRFADGRTDAERGLHATLRYVAGAIFEAAGELNDAEVAYRNALALDATLAPPGDVWQRSRAGGTVLVVLEQGFAPHRVEEALAVMLLPEEVHAIAEGSATDRTAVSAFVAGRILEYAAAAPAYGTGRGPAGRRGATLHVPAPARSIVPSTRTRTVCTTRTEPARADTTRTGTVRPVAQRSVTECTEKEEAIEGLPYLLRVAWPVYRSDPRPAAAARLLGTFAATGGDAAAADGAPGQGGSAAVQGGGAAGAKLLPAAFTGSAAAGNVASAVLGDFERERAIIVARTIARGTAKLALTKSAEKKLEEKNEAAGRLLGLLGNVGNVLLERADTRSWHLLPAAVSIARIELPPGTHQLTVEVGHAGAHRTVPLDTIHVRAGSMAVVATRTW